MKKKLVWLLLPLLTLLGLSQANAQMITDAIKWNVKMTNNDKGEVTLTFNAKLQPGWHVYDVDMPADGPTSTEIEFDGGKGFDVVGKMAADRKPDEVYDENFGMTLRWFGKEVNFVQKVKITDPQNFKIAGDILFMICNDQTCLPPDRFAFSFTAKNLTTPLISISLVFAPFRYTTE